MSSSDLQSIFFTLLRNSLYSFMLSRFCKFLNLSSCIAGTLGLWMEPHLHFINTKCVKAGRCAIWLSMALGSHFVGWVLNHVLESWGCMEHESIARSLPHSNCYQEVLLAVHQHCHLRETDHCMLCIRRGCSKI